MKKQILIFALAFILLASFILVDAKQIAKEDKLDWKATKLTIKDDGVYNNKVKIKEQNQAEIWIDKYEEKNKEAKLNQNNIQGVYHVDSLVKEDTTINIELFYDIQPDTIYYQSETGKYQEYVTWTWTDKVCVNPDEYCGGYALIKDVTLEYATGSNTFTSAISGATWTNDGIDLTLTENTDYNITGTTFKVADQDLAYTQIELSYGYYEDINTIASTIAHLIEVFIAISFLAFIIIIVKNSLGDVWR